MRGYEFLGDVPESALAAMTCAHPLLAHGYGFVVPLLPGEHVTEDAGTGFVHTAPSHGREDFELWTASTRLLAERGIETRIPYTVDADGVLTDEAPGFTGKRVLTEKGEKGDANDAVLAALQAAGALVARGKLKHQYPHSWRSKKPVIFRNTPQWFLAMDRPFANASGGRSLRELAVDAIEQTRWVPKAGENRIKGMVANKPDWVLSRQRAWGVPLAIFVRKGEHEILYDEDVNARIADAFEGEGADAWFAEGAKERFLGDKYKADDYDKIDNLVEVWFDSGSTHAFVLEDGVHFPGLAGIRRIVDGGPDEVMYLEGSDQHRGWFQSSLLESCGTRGRAPFDIVLTHGFTLDEKGRKKSKSLGNQTFPQDVIRVSGADILRLWVASVDYSDDQRIGPEILKVVGDNYRKLRNTLRWMLGTLAHHDARRDGRARRHGRPRPADAAQDRGARREGAGGLRRLRLRPGDLAAFGVHERRPLRLLLRHPQGRALLRSAVEPEAPRRAGGDRAHLPRGDDLARAGPRLHRRGGVGLAAPGSRSVHLEQFPEIPAEWRDDGLAERWETIRALRSAVTGAIEIARADKRIGSSLEAAPRVYLSRPEHIAALEDVDFAEVCITSDIAIETADAAAGRRLPPPGAAGRRGRHRAGEGRQMRALVAVFRSDDRLPDFPDVTPRDAEALRELRALGRLP